MNAVPPRPVHTRSRASSVYPSKREDPRMDTRFWSIVLIAAGVSLSAAGVVDRAQACSECMCGTPFPADVLGGVVPMQVTFGIEERFLSKTSGLDEGPGDEQEREHRVAGFALWRPLNRLAVLGRLPYNIKQVTDQVGSAGPHSQTSRGVGDAELTALVGVARGAGRHAKTLGLVLGERPLLEELAEGDALHELEDDEDRAGRRRPEELALLKTGVSRVSTSCLQPSVV